MTTAALATFALWFTVSFIAVLAGAMLARAAWRWKQLPAPLELVELEPPPWPRKIALTWSDNPRRAKFETADAIAIYTAETIRHLDPCHSADRPFDLLHALRDHGLKPSEITIKSDADYYGENPFLFGGSLVIFYKSAGII